MNIRPLHDRVVLKRDDASVIPRVGFSFPTRRVRSPPKRMSSRSAKERFSIAARPVPWT